MLKKRLTTFFWFCYDICILFVRNFAKGKEVMPKFRSPFIVSNYLLALANESGSYMSNLKLQKLVYYFQAWFYAYNKEPLFTSKIQAWIHGPVIPEIYHNYKSYGYHPIVDEKYGKECIKSFQSNFNKEELEFLLQIQDFYMSKTGYDLEKMSHLENPWLLAREGMSDDEPSEKEITLESMYDYYSPFISK